MLMTSRTASLEFAPDERLALDAERAVWRQVGDEVVILDVPTATYLTLNSSAVTLWKHLEKGASPAELAAELVATYAITEDKAARGRPQLSRGAPGASPDLAGAMNRAGRSGPAVGRRSQPPRPHGARCGQRHRPRDDRAAPLASSGAPTS